MKTQGGHEEQKRRAGEHAADLVADGMTIGLGTGSTAAYAIRAIGRAVDAGLDVDGVPTSFASRELARECGITLVALDQIETLDLAIDGADQFAGRNLIKGGGAAHAREKVIDTAAERFVVVADPSKEADALHRSVPVEVLPDARTTVTRHVRELGGRPELRTADRKDGPVVTDNGNVVLDCDFGRIDDPYGLAPRLASLPGVVSHGLFVDLADEIHVGEEEGVRVIDF